jgi:hypothetical protein
MQMEYLTLVDGIKVDQATINKARKNNGEALYSIGWEQCRQCQSQIEENEPESCQLESKKRRV